MSQDSSCGSMTSQDILDMCVALNPSRVEVVSTHWHAEVKEKVPMPLKEDQEMNKTFLLTFSEMCQAHDISPADFTVPLPSAKQ